MFDAAQTACVGAGSVGTNAKAIPRDKLTPVMFNLVALKLYTEGDCACETLLSVRKTCQWLA